MARELQQTAPDDRRRRVQRLKKMIIGIVIVGLLIPILCCVYLICRLHAINGTLRDLEQRLEELDARDREPCCSSYSQRLQYSKVSKHRKK